MPGRGKAQSLAGFSPQPDGKGRQHFCNLGGRRRLVQVNACPCPALAHPGGSHRTEIPPGVQRSPRHICTQVSFPPELLALPHQLQGGDKTSTTPLHMLVL